MEDEYQGAVGGVPAPQGEGRPSTDPARESKFLPPTPRSRSAPTFDEKLDVRSNTDQNVEYGIGAVGGSTVPFPDSSEEDTEEEVEFAIPTAQPMIDPLTPRTGEVGEGNSPDTFTTPQGRYTTPTVEPPRIQAFQPTGAGFAQPIPMPTGTRPKVRPLSKPVPDRELTVEEVNRLRREQIQLQRAKEDKAAYERELKTYGTPYESKVRQRGSNRYVDTDIDDDHQPGLHQMFKRVVKPVYNLNEPTTRDDESYIQRNREHLAQITSKNIRQALQQSLQPTEASLKEFTRDTVKEVRKAYEAEMVAMRVEMQRERETFASRLQRLDSREEDYF